MLPIIWMCATALGILLLALPSNAQTVIGVSAPMTGPVAFLGLETTAGARLAVEDINSSGGVLGTQLQVIVRDDRCNPAEGVRQAMGFLQRDRVVALIGYPCASVALAVSTVAAESNRLLIALSTSPELTTTRSQSMLRVVGRQDRLGVLVADLISVRYGGAIGLLRTQDGSFNAAFTAALERQGIPIRLADSPQNLPDNLNAVVVAPGPNYLALATSVAAVRPNTPVIIPSTFLNNQVASIATNNMIVAANPNPVDPRNLVQRARNEGVNNPGGPFFYAYAAVQVFADAARRASDREFRASSLFESARRNTIATVVGEMRFDERGDLADWRFVLATVGPNQTFNMTDVCLSPQCRRYAQCPRDCPRR
jgi:branched-chain amino acid transport system substrate-binding protein